MEINDLDPSFEEELRQLEELQSLMSHIESVESNNLLDIDMDYFKIKTKFTNSSNNPDPEYAKVGDSGFDLRAFIDKPVTLKPLERKLIPTGLKFELSSNTELQVRPRSGMALKYGISVLNTPGTVDEGYRGDVGIIVVNLSNEEYTIEPGERIAQGVIMNVVGQGISDLIKVEKLNDGLDDSSDKTFYDGGKSYKMDIRKDKFIHFTSKDNVDKIINEKKLKSDNSIFAVSAIWGKYSKWVLPKDTDNLVAIYFTTDTKPKTSYAEEVIWGGPVNLLTVEQISYDDAINILKKTRSNSRINTDDEVKYY